MTGVVTAVSQPFQGHRSGVARLARIPTEVEQWRATNGPKPCERAENQRRGQISTQRRKDAEAQKYEEGERRFNLFSFFS